MSYVQFQLIVIYYTQKQNKLHRENIAHYTAIIATTTGYYLDFRRNFKDKMQSPMLKCPTLHHIWVWITGPLISYSSRNSAMLDNTVDSMFTLYTNYAWNMSQFQLFQIQASAFF